MPPAAADAPAATLRVKFWPEPSKWDDRRRRPRSNTQPMQFAVAEIVPAADKFRELLQKLIAPDTRNAMAMARKLPLCLVGIEACASSHHWSRELQALGPTVRLMPPAYVKRHKNDSVDAEAICEDRQIQTETLSKSVIALQASDLCTCCRPSVGTENLVPEEVNYTKIAIRVTVMNKVQFLLASEPRKPLKPRPLYVIFLVEKDMRVKRRRACDYHHHKKI